MNGSIRRRTAGWILILLLSNGALGYWAWRAGPSDPSGRFIEKYPLLSKRLSIEDQNDFLLDFEPLRQEIKNYLRETGIRHSFYFEYLPSGVSIGSGVDDRFVGASLMKTQAVMDIFRLAEKGKVNLDEPVTLTEEHVETEGWFGNVSNLWPGTKITLREAAKLTLTLSDNTAASFIASFLDKVPVADEILNWLDLEVCEKSDQGTRILISAKSYSSILKCLYLACFLSPENSQEILGYLSESKNRERLPGGVPETVTVANKIGVFWEEAQSDCAIVYEPGRPYLICLMLSTPDSRVVAKHFQTISKMVY